MADTLKRSTTPRLFLDSELYERPILFFFFVELLDARIGDDSWSRMVQGVRRKRTLLRIRRAACLLDIWAAILPARVEQEELGDYVEDVLRRAAKGQRFLVWLRVVAAIFWTGVNAVGYFIKEMGRRRAT